VTNGRLPTAYHRIPAVGLAGMSRARVMGHQLFLTEETVIEFMLILVLLLGGIAILAGVVMTAPKPHSRAATPTPRRRHHEVRPAAQPAAQPADETWVVGRPARALARDAT